LDGDPDGAGGTPDLHGDTIAAATMQPWVVDVVTRNYIHSMRAVGVRDLKANLSRYLREVERGEVVLVTDRGRVVAELRAAPQTPEVESDVERGLRRLAARAPLSVREPHDPSAYRASPLQAPDGTARGLLDAERGER
jgi:antitoxin (DNA-binding transcriptional repressor) of toxin-antitoxin stability system